VLSKKKSRQMNEPGIKELKEQFLSEHRESDGGYAPVCLGDLYLLDHIISKFVAAKWDADPDGDHPISWEIVDRTEFRGMIYQPVPYLHFEDTDDREKVSAHEEALLFNLEVAVEQWSRYQRSKKFNKSIIAW